MTPMVKTWVWLNKKSRILSESNWKLLICLDLYENLNRLLMACEKNKNSWNNSIMTWTPVPQHEKANILNEILLDDGVPSDKNVVPGHHKMGQNCISVEPF